MIQIGRAWNRWRERVDEWWQSLEPPAPIAIETERLLLRDVCEEDIEPLLAFWGEPAVLRFHPRPSPRTVSHRVYAARTQPRTHYELAIVLRGEGCLIGDC